MASVAPFAFAVVLLVLPSIYSRSFAAPAANPSEPALSAGHRTRPRSLTMFYSPSRRYATPAEQEFLDDDDDSALDIARDQLKGKRQFDDYGHMRFGKRGDDQFDDYGHMRFGRSADE